jgi:hypothetical protein
MRKASILMLIIFLVTFLSSCKVREVKPIDTNEVQRNLPTLSVTNTNKSISMNAVRGRFDWTVYNEDGTNCTILADHAGSMEMIKNIYPLAASNKDSLSFNFSKKPTSFRVYIIDGDRRIEQDILDNKVVVIQGKGLVVYEVIADWKQGTIGYAFSVEVS